MSIVLSFCLRDELRWWMGEGLDMSEPVRRLLELFDALPASEKEAAVLALLRRHHPAGDVPDQAFDLLADELLARLDAEESVDAAER
jgi:microcystin degradation protein MlrC